MFLACSVHYFAPLFPSTLCPSLMTDVTLYFEANYAGSWADFTWSVSCPALVLSHSLSRILYSPSHSLYLSLNNTVFNAPFIYSCPITFLSLPCWCSFYTLTSDFIFIYFALGVAREVAFRTPGLRVVSHSLMSGASDQQGFTVHVHARRRTCSLLKSFVLLVNGTGKFLSNCFFLDKVRWV